MPLGTVLAIGDCIELVGSSLSVFRTFEALVLEGDQYFSSWSSPRLSSMGLHLSVMALIVSLDHLCECVEKLYLEYYTLHHAYLLLPIFLE